MPRPAARRARPAPGLRRGGAALALCLACDDPGKPAADGEPTPRSCPPAAGLDPALAPTPAAALARALGRRDHLMIGLGNDLIGDFGDAWAWKVGPPVDLHYLYLVGLVGEGGWPDWNADGGFIDLHARVAAGQCAIPMFTLYAMAARGEGDLSVLTDSLYMGRWWRGYRLAIERLGAHGGPAVLHLEPDFWGFAQQAAPAVGGWALPARVRAHNAECGDLPDDLQGLVRCAVRLARAGAPAVKIGLHASKWAHPDADGVAAFLLGLGADQTDLLVVETLDRDAGCFEAAGDGCDRQDGPWYWDEADQAPPTFAEHLAWAAQLHARTGLPLLWWQTPLGRPSDTPGGRPGAWRDNRVRYLFDHPSAFVAAGGVGLAFGPGAPGQTTLASDGGQFEDRWRAYAADPTPLSP